MDVFKTIDDILLLDEKPSNKIEILMKEQEFIDSDFNIFNKLVNVPQDKKYHPEGNVWNHTKMVVDLASKIKKYSINSEIFMWSSIFHDIGKIKTTKFIKGRYRSYNHDLEGEKVTYNILKKYMNEDKAESISEMVRFHMHHIYILKDLPFSNIDKLIKSSNYQDIILLFICDKLGRGNQSLEEKINTVNDVVIILDKLEGITGKSNNDIKTKINNIKEIIIK